MSFRIGASTPSAIYLGTTPIYKAYRGTTLLFDLSYITTQSSDRITTQSGLELITQSTDPQ